MYFLVSLIQSLGSLGLIICSFFAIEYWQVYLSLGIINFIFFPIYQELLYNLIAYVFFSQEKNKMYYQKRIIDYKNCNGLIYNQNYNIKFFGIEKLHPFDSQKYSRTYNRLIELQIIEDTNTFKKIEKVQRYILLQNMSIKYLISLNYSLLVSKLIEIPICFLFGFLIRLRLLNPMLYASQGTIESGSIAIQKGFCINLGGGYHHASRNSGGGFCVYPDISMLVNHLYNIHNIKKIMIIDLDAHQGNGYERDFLNQYQDNDDYDNQINQNQYKDIKEQIQKLQVFILDAYNHEIYPNDYIAKQRIDCNISVSKNMKDQQYLEKIKKQTSKAIENFKPQFIIYNAGTDCLVSDPLGQLKISQQGIIQRDETIFKLAFENHIPISMLLSGGYQQTNYLCISNSIANLFQKFNFDK